MVGICTCGKVKWNMHNTNLAEIPWLCPQCKDVTRDLNNSIRNVVQASLVPKQACVSPKKKPMSLAYSKSKQLQLT